MPKLIVLLWLIFLTGTVARAENIRTQTVSLHRGWNAVFLQVDPTNSKPADCFSGTPVSIVASHVADGAAVQYVQNPSTNNINKDNGWAVWYASDRPDAFLTRLHSLNANQAYLVHAKSDYTWTVTGTGVLGEVKRQPALRSQIGRDF